MRRPSKPGRRAERRGGFVPPVNCQNENGPAPPVFKLDSHFASEMHEEMRVLCLRGVSGVCKMQAGKNHRGVVRPLGAPSCRGWLWLGGGWRTRLTRELNL